jgi:hypothetical protein
MGFIGRNPNRLVYHGVVLGTMTTKFEGASFTVDLTYRPLVKSKYRDNSKKEPQGSPCVFLCWCSGRSR